MGHRDDFRARNGFPKDYEVERRGECEQIRLSLLQPGPDAAARFLPRQESNGASVDLLKTLVDLLAPSFFRAIVDSVIKALDQRVDQRGTSLSRKRQRIFQHLCCVP